jgi:hypothetical protein
MPAHNIDLRDPQNVSRILLALCIEAGGELRIKARTYDTQDRSKLLIVDFDARRSHIVIRATSGDGSAAKVAPESYQWTAPVAQAPLERSRVAAAAEAARRAIPSDEDLADLEEKAQRDRDLAKAVEEGKTPIRLKTIPPNRSAS